MYNEYMKQAEEALVHAYNRFPVVFEKGEGVYLYDTDGKEYLDFAAGIAVCALGYGHPEYAQAVKEQAEKLLHTSNLFYTAPGVRAAASLAEACRMDRVFFTNSGTESVEGALKTARKYAFRKHGGDKYEFIAMKHSFHGRSMGALSVTGTEKYRTPFEPLVPGVKFGEFNHLESIEQLISEKTCAVILEPVQGEGGIYPADQGFLEGVRALCDKYDALLIFDEIQCGMGRTGNMFAWQGYGVKPDVMAMAKAIGGGVPVGAFAYTEKVAEHAIEPGDHGTTYGGNPLVCAAVDKVIEIIKKDNLMEHVQRVSAYLELKLDQFAEEVPQVTERRGKGLMQGLVLNVPVGDVVKKGLEKGLVVISAGSDVLRLVPPLIIEEKHVDLLIEKLKECF